MKLTALSLAIALVGSQIAYAQGQSTPLPKEELQALAATYHMLRESFVKPLSGEEILQAALRGMLKELDPDGGKFLMKEDIADLQSAANYSGGAVGMEMILRNGEVVVGAPIPGSPAERAGIRPDDVVYAVDATPTGGNIATTLKMLRGPLDSLVRVTIGHRGESAQRDIIIERKRVSGAGVLLTLPTPDIAVLRITAFRSETLMQLAEVLTAQWARQPFKGIVLDLRRNSGGLLETSIGVASLFLPPKSLVVQVRGRTPEAGTVYFAAPEYYTKGSDPLATVPTAIRALPLVVLVDELTASGAEIVVAALRDHHRARIVGRKTFGRTSIQSFKPFGTDRAIRFTSAYWFPPSYERLDKVGIMPDHPLAVTDFQQEIDAAIGELRRQLH